MTLQQGNSKNKVLFIGVPIISVSLKFYTHNQQVFMGHGTPFIQDRVLEQQLTQFLPSTPHPPDQCTPMMNWLTKHETETNEIIKLVEMYRGEIEGRIRENRNRELEVDDIGKRLQQLNREVIQIRNCFMLVTQFQIVGLIDRYKAVRQMEKDYQKE